MDWTARMKSTLYVFPKGMARTGCTYENPAKWTSKYGSIVTTMWDCVSSDGMNEAGLGCHNQYLAEATFGERNVAKEGVSLPMYVQYLLDNFATVAEAIEGTKKIQLMPVFIEHKGIRVNAPVHFALDDKTGDSAIIEVIDGKLNVYHSPEYTTMTNSPPYAQQLLLQKEYVNQGGTRPIGGSPEAEDRFSRAKFYGDLLPDKPENYRMAVAGILSVMRNAATPYGINDPKRPNISATIWTTVCDLTNLRYYFQSCEDPSLVWVDFKDLDLSEGAPVKYFFYREHRDSEAVVGNIAKYFKEPKTEFKWTMAGEACDMSIQ